jgi:broad specificity phosphatase PhoE
MEDAMKLYFVRHGESEANVLNIISNRGEKHGLTESGQAQAIRLAENLSTIHAQRIYTSPLLRAVETAAILAGRLRVSYTITDALNEWDCGEAEGKSDEESWQKHHELMEAWLHLGQWEKRIPGGESLLDVRKRFKPFVQELITTTKDKTHPLILVGHGGLFICMLPLLLMNLSPDFAFSHPFLNTSYVDAETRSDGLYGLSWCGTKLEG